MGCFESIDKCGKERDEEQKQTQRDCEELNQLTLEVREFEKMKEIKQRCPERMEQKKIKCKQGGVNCKRNPKVINKTTITRNDDPLTGNDTSTKMVCFK